MSTRPCRVAVLGSGQGTNFEVLASAGGDRWRIVAAGSDRPGAPLLARAGRRGIPVFGIDPDCHADRDAHDAAMAAELVRHRPDLVVLAGYMRILGPRLLEPWHGRMLNIHPSLLPAWPGLRTHQRVIEAGERLHGATVHFVTPQLDGGPRIIQGRLEVTPGETVATLADRVRRLEHRIYPLAVDWYANGRLSMGTTLAMLDGMPLHDPVIVEETECV